MTTQPLRFRREAFGVGAVLALLCAASLTACGGSDSAGDASTDTSTSTTSEAGEATLTKLTIQRSANAGWQPVVWAAENGYFEDQGLDVTVKTASSDITKNIPLVVSGAIDITESSVQPLTAAVGQGLPVRAVLGVQNATSKTAQDDGCLAPPGSSITDLSGLEGAKVAVPSLGHPVQIVNNVAMRAQDLDPSKVKYVALDVSTINEAGSSGKVDAICTFGPFFNAAVADGFTPLNGGTVGEIPNAAQLIWLATDKFATENADTLAKFAAAMDEAYTYLNEHPDDYRQVTLDNSDQSKADVKAMAIPDMSTAISRSATETIVNEMKLSGFIDEAPSVDDLIDSSVPDL
ncbi:MAG: ABC transporter substrate-binding protein [Nocardioidaceae bacterium]